MAAAASAAYLALSSHGTQDDVVALHLRSIVHTPQDLAAGLRRGISPPEHARPEGYIRFCWEMAIPADRSRETWKVIENLCLQALHASYAGRGRGGDPKFLGLAEKRIGAEG
jgi:hypothetical protein